MMLIEPAENIDPIAEFRARRKAINRRYLDKKAATIARLEQELAQERAERAREQAEHAVIVTALIKMVMGSSVQIKFTCPQGG